MFSTEALQTEYQSLAKQYRMLDLPLCLYSKSKHALKTFTEMLQPCSVIENVAQLSITEQRKLCESLDNTDKRYVFHLTQDPFLLVAQAKLCKKLAVTLMQVPLEVITPQE